MKTKLFYLNRPLCLQMQQHQDLILNLLSQVIPSSNAQYLYMYMSEFEYELTEFKYEQKFRNIEFIAACVSNFSRTPEDNVYTCLIKTRL